MEAFYFSLKFQVVHFTQEVALSVVVCSPLVSLALGLQESACWCARPEDFPEVIQVLIAARISHWKLLFILGKIRTYFKIPWCLNSHSGMAFNSHSTGQLNQVIGDLHQCQSVLFIPEKVIKTRTKLEHLSILCFKVS